MNAPLYGAEIADIIETLLADVAELKAENGRMKTLLALHGVTPIEECRAINDLAREVSNLQVGVQQAMMEAVMARSLASQR